MKWMLLLTGAFSFFGCMAQTEGPAALYGYVQTVSPGAPPRNIDEGMADAKTQSGKNYFIYIEADTRVYPAAMWIEGVAYSPRMRTIASTPVKQNNANVPAAAPVVLVPQTNRKVLQLIPAPAIESKNSEKAASMAEDHELVVLYKMNGKFYYNTLTKLEKLPAAAGQ